MSQRYYRNGYPINLTPLACDGCSPSVIQGVLCHEAGCPDEWRDQEIACFECGCDFQRDSRFQRICEDCANPVEEPDETSAD